MREVRTGFLQGLPFVFLRVARNYDHELAMLGLGQLGQLYSHDNVRLQVRRELFTPECQSNHGTLVQWMSVLTKWPVSRWSLAVEPTRTNLVLTTSFAWRVRATAIVVTAKSPLC